MPDLRHRLRHRGRADEDREVEFVQPASAAGGGTSSISIAGKSCARRPPARSGAPAARPARAGA
jgi:hypothetical protein